ncbi:MAG: glycogen/starch synthase [Candidatus Paceibacterota bacterium]|jgi:starch synthase
MPIGFFNRKKPLKILFVATEAAPFAKVGGLASVMHSLPASLSRLGHDVRVMIPRYLSIDDSLFHLKMDFEGLSVPTGNDEGPDYLTCNVKRHDPEKGDAHVTTYFLENQEYYEQRANVYGYADDTVRWGLLCRGALEFVRLKSSWTPDVIVSSDWQIALIPNLLKTEYARDPVLSKVASVFSIHNLYFQAMFDHRFVSEMDFDDGHSPVPGLSNPRLSKINWMRRGIMYADVINTVSPTYAREIMTKDYGELLDELLRERKAVVSGILNGIDYSVWDPEADPLIAENYSSDKLEDRAGNKSLLQERFGLPVRSDAFIVSIVSRLSKQKGFDLLYPVLSTLLSELPMQLIVVGEGESEIMSYFHDLETKFPGKVANHLKFDAVLPHAVFAGADVVLVPSQFEPCGLTTMEAMRMGTIPIVRKTGGLADQVEDYRPDKRSGTGFLFEKFDHSSLMIALVRAFENFRDKEKWGALQKRAMARDFSWDSSAAKYVDLFHRALQIHQ